MRKVLLLGASGNIGGQVLDIIEKDSSSFELIGISIGKNISKGQEILKRFPSIKFVCVKDEENASCFDAEHVYFGDEGLINLINDSNPDMVVNALVGFAGLMPSIVSLTNNKILCLANKESLVVGGEKINKLLNEGHGILYPIDSEHVALAKCLSKVKREDVDKLVITASGGSFRKLSRKQLEHVTVEDALRHPTWSMGKKITIDSATMFNKGFEVIEAYHLFHFPLNKIEVLMHDESYVHSALLMKDGTYYADVCKPDMHGPIEYALYEGKNKFEVFHKGKIGDFGNFTFHKFDPERYPSVEIAIGALKEGGLMPTVLNAANEEAVYLFLDGKIPFLSIETIVRKCLGHFPNKKNPTIRDIRSMDFYVRTFIQEKYGRQ